MNTNIALANRNGSQMTVRRTDGAPLSIPEFLNLVSLSKWGINGTFSRRNAFSDNEIQIAATACAEVIKNPPKENAVHPGYPDIEGTVSFARNVLNTIEGWAGPNL